MAAFRRILSLIVKEFLALLKERQSRFVIIGPPIIQMLVFGYAATYDITNIRYAVVDQDRSSASTDLLANFRAAADFDFCKNLPSPDLIAEPLNNEEILMAIHIQPDFARNLRMTGSADVQLIIDGRNSNTAMIALNYARQIVEDFNRMHDSGSRGKYVTLRTTSWYNPNLKSRWFIIPGIVGILSLVVTIIVTALSVAREREQGTFDQLLVTPLRPVEIMIGKIVPGFAIGLVESTIIILLAVFWFGVPLRGSLLWLYAGLVVFLLSAIGVGLMISSLSATMQQALMGGFLFLVPSVILSGFATPIANMPEVMKRITLVNPLRYFLVILRGTFLEDAPSRIYLHQLWPMAVIAAVALTAATFFFRRRLH